MDSSTFDLYKVTTVHFIILFWTEERMWDKLIVRVLVLERLKVQRQNGIGRIVQGSKMKLDFMHVS